MPDDAPVTTANIRCAIANSLLANFAHRRHSVEVQQAVFPWYRMVCSGSSGHSACHSHRDVFENHVAAMAGVQAIGPVPRDGSVEGTLALFFHPFRFITERCRRL